MELCKHLINLYVRQHFQKFLIHFIFRGYLDKNGVVRLVLLIFK